MNPVSMSIQQHQAFGIRATLVMNQQKTTCSAFTTNTRILENKKNGPKTKNKTLSPAAEDRLDKMHNCRR